MIISMNSVHKLGYIIDYGTYPHTQSRNKKELIANFRQLTGSQQAAAEDYLTRANWDFNQAANLFFEQGASNPNSSINPATLFDIYKSTCVAT